MIEQLSPTTLLDIDFIHSLCREKIIDAPHFDFEECTPYEGDLDLYFEINSNLSKDYDCYTIGRNGAGDIYGLWLYPGVSEEPPIIKCTSEGEAFDIANNTTDLIQKLAQGKNDSFISQTEEFIGTEMEQKLKEKCNSYLNSLSDEIRAESSLQRHPSFSNWIESSIKASKNPPTPEKKDIVDILLQIKALDPYHSLDWDKATPITRWPGVYCNGSGDVTRLSLLGGMTTLPPDIQYLTTLKELDLSETDLEILPPEIGKLTNLLSLDCSLSNLSVLPQEIGLLSELRVLSITECHLHSIPASIGNLKKLLSLTLYDNNISLIPPEIGNLRNLEELGLSHNNISKLPAEVGKLQNLEYLLLNNNDLTSLPKELVSLENIKILSFDDDKITDVPEEIISRCLDEEEAEEEWSNFSSSLSNRVRMIR